MSDSRASIFIVTLDIYVVIIIIVVILDATYRQRESLVIIEPTRL